MRNLRLAFRSLAKTPFVTVVAVLSLALGIGANAAIFSLFNELLLAPLPVTHPEQLVNLGGNRPSPGSHQCGIAGDCDWVFSYRMFRDLEAQPGPFSGIAAHYGMGVNVAFRGNTTNVHGELVSGSYFPVLGVNAVLGRPLGVDDDKTIGGHPVVVLSYDYWQNQLGGDPSVVGQQIAVNGQRLTIIGVAAAGFDGTTLGVKPAMFLPISMRAVISPGWSGYDDRRRYWVYLFARLKPGMTIDRAAAQQNVLYQSITNNVEVPLQNGISEKVLARFKSKRLELADGRRGSSTLYQQTRTPLVLLFGITLFVLTIACANIANLLLARATNRATEMTVRLSLGATRRQLIAQLLTEAVLLAAIGGLAGLFVAWSTLHLIVSLLPTNISSTLSFALSGNAIGFAGALSMATGVLFGLFPALHATRPDLVSALRDGSGKTSATRGATRFRTSLVTAQIALSMALLVSAGLFIKSLANVSRVSLGVDVDGVVTFHVAPGLNSYPASRSRDVFAALERELAAIPGVHAVTAARVGVLANDNWDNGVSVQGFPKTPDTDDDAYYNAVGPAFFHSIGETLIAGRDFTSADVDGAPLVAIVNESFTKKFNLGNAAVGKMMGEGNKLTHQIIGVVKDSRYSGVKQDMRPVYFMSYKQDTTVGSLNFYVRSALPSDALMPQIRATVRKIDPALPVVGLKTMPQQIRDNVYLDRMISTLSAAFAALATLLAAIGLYGVLAYSVVQRTKEIGVRMALGAKPSSIVRMVLRHVAVMTVVGALAGAIAAFAIGRGAQSLLFGLQGNDPIVMAAAATMLAVVALAAGSIPAVRASRIDPVRALRYE
jgi:predicted permease